jgi:hypothetical protein
LQPDPNEIFFCGSISGNRFSTGYTFTDAQRGRYILDAFLFFDSSSQFPRGIAGVLYVE